MRLSVIGAFHEFSEDLEGRVPFMYLDSAQPEAWVTVGVGNKIDPSSDALRLPFVHPSGLPATRDEIFAAWHTVKARQDMAQGGGVAFGKLKGNELRLTQQGIDALVMKKLAETNVVLAHMFASWDDWPACAQLALASWAWGCGPHRDYPLMIAALRERDFMTASEECAMNPKRGTIITRNTRNRILLRNAARVDAFKLNPDLLDWTHDLSVADEETPIHRILTPLPDSRIPPRPSTPADNPTVAPNPILHVDPSLYFLEKDPDDPDGAA